MKSRSRYSIARLIVFLSAIISLLENPISDVFVSAFAPPHYHSYSKNSVVSDGAESKSRRNAWRSYNPDELENRYGFFISAVVPRPVAVITTVDQDSGVVNCAPFSYTSISSHDPPIVTHGISIKAGGIKKDTLRNIESTGQWVYNILTTNYLEAANACAGNFDPTTSEINETNLSTLPCQVVSVPRLAEAPVSLECELYKSEEIFNDDGQHTTTIVMGRVRQIHVQEEVLKDDCDEEGSPVVDLQKFQPVGRAGDVTYYPVGVSEGSALPMPRPK